MAQFQRTPRPEELSDPVRLAIRERNFLLQAQLAMREYFSILDLASGLSASGRREFAEVHATHIFKRILTLQSQSGDTAKLHDVLDRCRRWPFFEYACEKDQALAATVRHIENDTGVITIQFNGGQSVVRGKLLMPDGKEYEVGLYNGKAMELAAGDYFLYLEDGLRAFFRIVPGSNDFLFLPALPEDLQAVVIPGDHFFINLPTSGEIRCNLDSFVIMPHNAPSFYSFEEAGEILESLNATGRDSWRLPHAAELSKAWKREGGDGKISFYGLPEVSGPVLLYNGEFYDPATGRVEHDAPGHRGLLYLVKSIE
jgi:hypothetical protein